MKNLSIAVSSIANVVTNGDFELWENNIPLSWTGVNGDGNVNYGNTLWGLGVQLSIPEELATTNPSISQVIPASKLEVGSYTIGYWAKGDTTVSLSGGASFSVNHLSSEWKFEEDNFICDGTETTLTLSKRYLQGNITNVCFYDNVYIYKNDWYNNKKYLNITQIKNFENFIREVEDDLFTFKSDALSFTIRNYGSDGSYFNTNDFETYSDRIFRFDILATYSGANGSDITKKMVLFSNNDTITKTRQPLSNDLSIQLYELSTLFKDNGWFLGKVTTEDEEVFFKYNTYSGTDPSIVTNNISTNDVLVNLEGDIRDLIRRHFIPVPLSDFSISDGITAGTEQINVNYDWLINISTGTYALIDIFISPEGRVFTILASQSGALSYPSVWEIINGSTMVQLPDVQFNGTDMVLGAVDLGYSIGFIHDTSKSSTYSGGENITFGVIIERIVEYSGAGGTEYYMWNYLYTDNAGKPEEDSNDYDIQFLSAKSTNVGLTEGRGKTAYFDNGGFMIGDISFPEINFKAGYSVEDDNMLWIQNNPSHEGNEGTYSTSDIEIAGTDYRMTTAYATTFNALIYRFPQNYTFIFKDAYPSDILKDICVSQDALWYLDYSQTTDDITLTIKNRAVGDSSETITDNIALREDSFVRRIKFKDLDGTIFRDDATRLNYYLSYYNSTYGGGRFEKEFEMWGCRDYAIGDTVTFENNNYFIKRFELYTKERKTLVTLFQKAD